jgi:hypothetical protein
MTDHPKNPNEDDAWFDPKSETYYVFKDGAWVENDIRHPEYRYGPMTTEIVTTQPTMDLRWRNGVLQQCFIKYNLRGGDVVKRTEVWRDVPTENGDDRP